MLLQHIHISIFASGKFLLSPSWKLCEAATRHNRSNDSVVSVSQGKKRLQVNCIFIVQTAHFIFEKNYHCIVAKCPNSLGLNKTLYLTLKQRDETIYGNLAWRHQIPEYIFSWIFPICSDYCFIWYTTYLSIWSVSRKYQIVSVLRAVCLQKAQWPQTWSTKHAKSIVNFGEKYVRRRDRFNELQCDCYRPVENSVS